MLQCMSPVVAQSGGGQCVNLRQLLGEQRKSMDGRPLMENRNGLIIDARLTVANGTAERTTALGMIEDNAKSGSTVGGDKNYDTADFVAGCRERGCTPHVSQNDTNRRSAIDARTTRHPGRQTQQLTGLAQRAIIETTQSWQSAAKSMDER